MKFVLNLRKVWRHGWKTIGKVSQPCCEYNYVCCNFWNWYTFPLLGQTAPSTCTLSWTLTIWLLSMSEKDTEKSLSGKVFHCGDVKDYDRHKQSNKSFFAQRLVQTYLGFWRHRKYVQPICNFTQKRLNVYIACYINLHQFHSNCHMPMFSIWLNCLKCYVAHLFHN